jgi:prepilin-type N-terminal cleavage/methylation domain-containing protein
MKRAFTLIELLVVIAIIAILAAILFPVFAQAKVAAKKAALISNAKQFGTSQMLYLTDADDVFCPVLSINANWEMNSWAVQCMPYMKSVGILMDPFAPAKITDNPFILNSQWGMPPRRAASAYCPTNENDLSGCAMGIYNPNGRTQLTGGERWGRSGIAGANITPDAWMYIKNWYRANVPSMSSTAVTRPADTLLITQSNTPDLMWASDWNPDEAFRYWGDANFNLWGNSNMTCGPAGRIGTTGAQAGVYPTSISEPSVFPTGINSSVYTDGHAKAQPWRAMHSQTVSNGTVKYLKYASPEIP